MVAGGRVRLNGWQQAAVALGSAVGALLDPRRADLIAALGETTGRPFFERVLERMKKSPEGQIDPKGCLWPEFKLSIMNKSKDHQDSGSSKEIVRQACLVYPVFVAVVFLAILLEHHRVISANVGHAWDLPENTFGAAYVRFMGSRNFSPDDRPPVRFMETEELAYVAMRAREVHDFWHTLFGLPTNLIGESALKVIEFEQMLLPMCLVSVAGGTARFNQKQRALFFQHYFPWASRAGLQCTDLISVYYERHFHEDLEGVRRRWGIVPAPAAPKPDGMCCKRIVVWAIFYTRLEIWLDMCTSARPSSC